MNAFKISTKLPKFPEKLQTYIDKGVIPSMQLFSSDEYNDMLADVKDMFS